jgi:hypothetical protein
MVLSFFDLCASSSVLQAYTLDPATRTASTDGRRDDVAGAVAAVPDGWTVTIPAGSFTWSSPVNIIEKAIHLQGAGSGRIIGRSRSSVAVGTGLKTFTTDSALPLSPGQTIRLVNTYNGDNFMTGTVASYVGTVLTMTVTASGGSGTRTLWVIATDPKTVITNEAEGALIAVGERETRSAEISGIKFIVPIGSPARAHVRIFHGDNARPVLIHDSWFSGTGDFKAIVAETIHGVIWNCSFDASFDSGSPDGGSTDTQAIGLKWLGGGATWATPSTMGTADADGTSNFYIEDNDFHGMFLQGLDLDDNSRSVIRHNVFDNSAIVAHGQDTSGFGVRHWEIYDNAFLFDDVGADTFNLANGYFYIRGGTGVVADNSYVEVKSSEWGDPAQTTMTVQQIRRLAGPSACWHSGPPAPRQIGYGYVTGQGATGPGGYQGDLEPLYFWNNSGEDISRVDYEPDECRNGQTVTAYVRPGIEYIVGNPKPGYTKYPYPHPLRNKAIPAAPTNLRVVR